MTLDAKGARSVKAAQKVLMDRLKAAPAVATALKTLDREALIQAVRGALRGGDNPAFEELTRVRHALGAAKAPLAAELASNLVDDGAGPVVVFAHHRDVAQAIEAELSGKELRVATLLGGVSMTDRQAVIDRFQAGDLDALVASIDAAGVGLTLTRSSQVVMAELPWTPAQQSQAIDRVHRIGQTAPVTARRVLAEGTLDKKLAATISRKANIAAVAIDGGEEATETTIGDAEALADELLEEARIAAEKKAARAAARKAA